MDEPLESKLDFKLSYYAAIVQINGKVTKDDSSMVLIHCSLALLRSWRLRWNPASL